MGNVEVGPGRSNTLVLIDRETGKIVSGGWLKGGALARKIKAVSGKCNRCTFRVSLYSGLICSGLKWVSDTGAFHQSQNVTVGANYCPMRGDVYEIDLAN